MWTDNSLSATRASTFGTARVTSLPLANQDATDVSLSQNGDVNQSTITRSTSAAPGPTSRTARMASADKPGESEGAERTATTLPPGCQPADSGSVTRPTRPATACSHYLAGLRRPPRRYDRSARDRTEPRGDPAQANWLGGLGSRAGRGLRHDRDRRKVASHA